MMTEKSENVWWEKYRPQTIQDCILPESSKNFFQAIVDSGKLDNMSFAGSAGIGKTTVAKCLSKQLHCNELFINASQFNGIDMIRNEIVQFASTVSIDGGMKLVILDEADALTPNAQKALRHIIEQFSESTRFILTCNFPRNLIEALLSRCSNEVEFKTFSPEEKIQLQVQTLKRCIYILKNENIEFDQKDLPLLKDLIEKYYPDIRKILNALEKMCKSGKFLPLTTLAINEEMYKKLFQILKEKSFSQIRNWCAEQGSMIDSDTFFTDFYNLANTYIELSSLPNVILLISQYAYRSGFVADQEINMMSFLIEVCGGCQFK